MRNPLRGLRAVVYKEVLRRRGVIANARVRAPGSPPLDEHNHRELDAILRNLSPMLTYSGAPAAAAP